MAGRRAVAGNWRSLTAAWDTAGFRERVDNYLFPDGINLTLSAKLTDLCNEIERPRSWPGMLRAARPTTTANNAPFVVAWRVTADQRDAPRADEAQFLSSIRCR